MPVGANVRIAAPTSEPAIAAPGEAGNVEELFGEIIATIGETATQPAKTAEAATLQQPEAAMPQSAEAGATAIVEQLIALAAGQTAAPADGEPFASTLTPVPVTSALALEDEPEAAAPADGKVSAALEQLLSVLGRVAAPSPRAGKQAVPEKHSAGATDEPAKDEASSAETETPPTITPAPQPIAMPAAEVKLAAPTTIVTADSVQMPLPAMAQVAPQTTASKAQTEEAELSADAVAPKSQGEQTALLLKTAGPKIESEAAKPAPEIKGETPAAAPVRLERRTDAAVQQAFSSLQAAVKALPAQLWATSLQSPAESGGDRDQASPLQDLKLAPLGPLATIGAPLVQSGAMGSADQPQIAAATAPKTDNAGLAVERQLDMAHEGEWLDQLARDIAQSAGSDKNPLRFRLNPETLGTLRVEISQDRHGAAVRLTTDSEAARTIIADAQPRLIAEARAQGIRISEAHVDLGSQPQSGDPRRQNQIFQEAPVRTARSLQEQAEGDGNPTPGRSERYA